MFLCSTSPKYRRTINMDSQHRMILVRLKQARVEELHLHHGGAAEGAKKIRSVFQELENLLLSDKESAEQPLTINDLSEKDVFSIFGIEWDRQPESSIWVAPKDRLDIPVSL